MFFLLPKTHAKINLVNRLGSFIVVLLTCFVLSLSSKKTLHCTKPLSTIQCNKTLGQDKLVYTTHRLNALAAPPGIRV